MTRYADYKLRRTMRTRLPHPPECPLRAGGRRLGLTLDVRARSRRPRVSGCSCGRTSSGVSCLFVEHDRSARSLCLRGGAGTGRPDVRVPCVLCTVLTQRRRAITPVSHGVLVLLLRRRDREVGGADLFISQAHASKVSAQDAGVLTPRYLYRGRGDQRTTTRRAVRAASIGLQRRPHVRQGLQYMFLFENPAGQCGIGGQRVTLTWSYYRGLNQPVLLVVEPYVRILISNAVL